MLTCPVRLTVTEYSGKNPKKQIEYQAQLRLASRMEDYLNSQMDASHMRTFTNFDIAQALGAEKDSVAAITYHNDCGSNGITIVNPKNAPKEQKGESKSREQGPQ